jgi:hypothetical protein
MIQRLVTSNPSPAYVERVARAFNNNGAGVRGDLKAVWTAVLLDDEAHTPERLSDPAFGKLREPMLRFVQWGRSFKAISKAGTWKLNDTSNPSSGLGQSPLRAPSVFNFYRHGYVPPGTVMASSGATAPEFQIVNETTVGGYLNYMQRSVIRNGVYTNNPTSSDPAYVEGTSAVDLPGDYTSLLALIDNTAITDAEAQRVAQSLVSKLNLLLCAGQIISVSQNEMVSALKAAMLQSGKRITSTSSETLKLDLVCSAVLLVMGCPDYLAQK